MASANHFPPRRERCYVASVMTTSARLLLCKELIADWIAQGAAAPLSAPAYSAVVTRHPELFRQLRQLGMLPVLPAYAKQTLGRCKQTPLGVLPLSLIELLGVFEGIFDHIIARAAPYCLACSNEAIPPVDIDKFAIPADGFLALVVVDDDNGVSLQERCEWLGSERALVHGVLVRTEDLVSDEGEPVIGIAPVANAISLQLEASNWFSRGGGELLLVHFPSRTATGVELGRLSGYWSCPCCKARFQQPSRVAIESAPLCTTCSGSSRAAELKSYKSRAIRHGDLGWLQDDTKRLVACRDCDGFGVVTDLANCLVFGVRLRHVLALTTTEFCALAGVLPEPLQEQLSKIIACGFGDYPFGAPIGLLSQGELARLSVLSAELSGFSAVHYLLDAAMISSQESGTALDQLNPPSIFYARPPQLPPCEVSESSELATKKASVDIVLRDLQVGVLNIHELRFPAGLMTVLRGPTGSGKSLLLSVVENRFAKRNKLAHSVSFGALKRCSMVRAAVDTDQTVLNALGLEKELAREISRTRRAQELGVLEEDLILPNSRYRCGFCNGGASQEQGMCGVCAECQGGLYDWRVAELGLAGRTVGELLSMPLKDLQGISWSSDWIESVVREFPEGLRDGVSLGTALASLGQPETRFISIWGGLMKVLAGSSAVRGRERAVALAADLVLIDGTSVMPVSHVQETAKLIIKIRDMGATIVYSDMPQGLESLSAYVLELRACAFQHGERASRLHLDTRYARAFNVVAL